ncbi:hypothetical protein ACP4OV_021900 [Aristida adscensionis]
MKGGGGGGGGGDKLGRSKQPPELPRLRLLFVGVGCFLFFLVFLLSSRRDATIISRTSRNFQVDVLPRQGEVKGEAGPKEPGRDAGGGATPGSDEPAPAAGAGEAAVRDNPGHVTATAQASPPPHPPEHDKPDEKQQARQHDVASDASSGNRPPLCDLSDARADVCYLAGDIRMDARASAFVVVDPAAGGANGTATFKVRPYARKGDVTSMSRVTEVTVRATADAAAAPRCTATHTSPAVVFSVSGYSGNIFHDFSDVLVPLYTTAQRYRGDVQLVLADAASWWLAKYGALVRELSRHAPLDLAAAGAGGEVHCFRHAVVGLRAHRELIIEPARSPDGLAMPDFARFLRRALSLPRDAPTRPGGGGGGGEARRKPRLLVISRRGTRLLLNTDAVVRAAEEVGFEVAVDGLDAAGDIAPVARLVNSFDAMVGVHGAGLTNMVFLPPAATVVQIVPWGGLRWIARLDFGDPAEAAGLRYVQYEVAVEESTLKDKYPRDSEIFANPTALHKKGFTFMRHTFLNGQDIIVDVDRFRAVLVQAFKNLTK